MAVARKDPSIRVPVKVIAKASQDEVAGWIGGALKVRVTAAPERGKANDAVLRMIAFLLDVPRANVRLVAGATQPRKVVEVLGFAQADFAACVRRRVERRGYGHKSRA